MSILRTTCLAISLLLHVAAGAVLLSSVRFPAQNRDLLTVDLTRLKHTDVAPEPPPLPEAKPQPPPTEQAAETGPPPQTPQQPDRPAIAPEDLPPQPIAKVATTPPPPSEPAAPTPQPQAAEAPSPIAPELPGDPPASEDPTQQEVDAEGRPIIRVGSVDGLAHRGHEGRFGRSLLADFYSYSPDEFAGQFVTRGGRTVSIIDARKTEYGRFLIYDSKDGSLRRLKKFNKYIYTIGPSLSEDEPITGSVTFLAKNDQIERFIYMPNDDTKALFPGKIHFTERAMSVPTCGVRIKSTLTLPKARPAPAVIFVHDSGCLPLETMQGASRALVAHDVAAAAFVPRGCTSCDEPVEGGLVEDAYRTLRLLRRQDGVNPERIGYLAVNGGIPTALEAASRRGVAFFVAVYTRQQAPKEMPTPQAIRALGIPSLWLFPNWGNGYTKTWNNLLKEKKISQTITLRKSTRDDRTPLGGADGHGNWVLRFAATDAAVVAEWVHALPKP